MNVILLLMKHCCLYCDTLMCTVVIVPGIYVLDECIIDLLNLLTV